MRIAASAGSEDRKKLYAYCGFAVIVAVYLYFQFFQDSSSPVTPPPVVVTAPASSPGTSSRDQSSTSNAPASPRGPAAKAVGTTSAALDPTLHMEAMLVTESVAYEGSGRNIFSAASAPPPVVIPRPITTPRPNPGTAFVPPPKPVPQSCPPQCPPIDLKFCGYFESPATGVKRAILLHGDDQFLAYAGEIVLRRYRVISISAKTIEIEDIPNNNKQTLPFVGN